MYIPLFFKASEVNCLIVGGGEIAAHKIKILLEAQSQITIISPDVNDTISGFLRTHKELLALHFREYKSGDCKRFNLVIAATSNREINRQISQEARALNIPVNVVDDPELCTVVFSAVWKEGPMNIAVSTSGAAPFLAAEVRNRLAAYGQGWGKWVEAGGVLRQKLLTSGMDKREISDIMKRFALLDPHDIGSFPDEESTLQEWLQWLEQR